MKRAIAPTDAELAAFRAQCAAVAGADTSPLPEYYNPAEFGPLHNHCIAVAGAVQARWGGAVVHGWIGPASDDHWWNVLPDGRAVDLTSAQFGGDGLHPPGAAAPWTQRHSALIQRVQCEAHVRRFQARLRAATTPEVIAA